jgi:hypothetical protein
MIMFINNEFIINRQIYRKSFSIFVGPAKAQGTERIIKPTVIINENNNSKNNGSITIQFKIKSRDER